MTGLSTDLVAVACILGGAAVSGATTMALMKGHDGHGSWAEAACVGTSVDAHPRVVVSMDSGKRTIVVTPRVWVHSGHDCAMTIVGSDVRMQMRGMKEMRARMERARAQLEQARIRMESDQVHLQAPDIPAQVQKDVQKQVQDQLRKLDEQLAKLDGGTGR